GSLSQDSAKVSGGATEPSRRPPPPRPSPARATAHRPERERAPPHENDSLQPLCCFWGWEVAPLSRSGWACGGRTGEGTGVRARAAERLREGASPSPT